MPTITRKLSGSTSIAAVNSSVTVAIDDNWNLAKTFMVFTLSTPTIADYYEACVISGKIVQGSGTKNLVFERLSVGVYIIASIEYQVIEMDEATVQRGAATFTASETSKTAVITSVDLTKTFVIATGRIGNNVGAYPDSFLITVELTSATQLTFRRGTATGNMAIEYMVVTISDIATLQTKTGSITSSGSNQTDITITSVNLNKTILFAYFRTTAAVFQSRHNRESCLTSETNLRLESYINISSGTLYYVVYVIEFNSSNVYRGSTSIASGNTAVTESIGGTIDITKSLAKLGGSYNCWARANTASYNSGDSLFRISSLTSTQITFTRGKTGIAAFVDWEVIEFTKISVPVFRRRRFIAFTRK